MERDVKILVLDDEPIVGRRLRTILSKLRCTIEIFTDPVQAFARLEQQAFDIVVTDIVMGEIDGIEVLERVLAQRPETKVIMISGFAMMSMARRAMERGAFDFVAKPFVPDEIREVVSRALAEIPAAEELPRCQS